MKRAPVVLVILLCVGCFGVQTNEEMWAEASVTYNTTLKILNDLEIPIETMRKIEPFRKAAAAALDRMELALTDGSTDFDVALDSFVAAIKIMKEETDG